LTGKVIVCMMIDGTARKNQTAWIDIDTPYLLSGKVEAVCMDRPLYDLIIGNVTGISDDGRKPSVSKPRENDKDEVDGSLYIPSDKASLMHAVEMAKGPEYHSTSVLDTVAAHQPRTLIVDAMAVLQSMKKTPAMKKL